MCRHSVHDMNSNSLARDLLRVNGYAMALLFGHENLLQLLHLLIF